MGIYGTAGDDILTGTSAGDEIFGGPTSNNDPPEFGNDTLSGGATGDQIFGFGGDDTLNGDAGNDNLYGADGNDNLHGGDDQDNLSGGEGDDVLDGGNGTDDAGYVFATAGVTVDLTIVGAQNTGGAGTDTLSNIEYVTGSRFGDTLIGDNGGNHLTGIDGNDVLAAGGGNDGVFGGNGNDVLYGDAGNDGLFGDAGDDVLEGGAGNDAFDGGAGTDTVSYASAPVGVNVSLSFRPYADLPQDTGGAGVDRMVWSIENLTGSGFADTLTGGGGANVLDGGFGNDWLDGAGSSDALYGGAGDDTLAEASQFSGNDLLDGGAGNDVLKGGGGDDVLLGITDNDALVGGDGNDVLDGGVNDDDLHGGEGTDTASYASATFGVDVNLALTGAQNTGGAGIDTLSDIQNLTGSAHNDTLTGDGGDNVLDGGMGTDTLTGGGGNDAYILQDVHRVGVLPIRFFYDTVDEAADGGVDTVHVRRTGATGIVGGYGLGANVENGRIIGDFNFSLFGNEIANLLSGNEVNNTLSGAAGNDVLAGGGGTDTLIGGDGDDSLSGGSGRDTASYVGATAAVAVSLLIAGSQNTVGAGTDTLSEIENLIGSDGDDTLTGDGLANVLDGGLGNDRLNGGAGLDTASYALAATAVAVNLALAGFQNTGGAGSDMLSGLENLTGTNDNDRLTGDGGVNALDGGMGDDILNGGAGNDAMTGGLGNDFFFVDGAGDFVDEQGGGGTDRIFARTSYALGSAEIEALSTDNSAGTSAINLTGNSLGNTITGNAGANTLDGKGGADLMIGLGGSDWYYVDNAADRAVEAAAAGSDRVLTAVSFLLEAGSEIEVVKTTNDAGTAAINLTGSSSANHLLGNAGSNQLNGRGGADIMQGLGGNDWYTVDNAGDRAVEALGKGVDQVFASVNFALEAGSEIEYLRTTNDAATTAINLTGNERANVIYGNAGSNRLDGKAGADIMIGLGGNDFYYVDNVSDRTVEATGKGSDRVLASLSFTLEAGSEIETFTTTNNAGTTAMNLTGNAFANVIYGNAGQNIINGGLGADTLFGLSGPDHFLFNTALGATNVDAVRDFDVAADFLRLENAVFSALAAGGLPGTAFRVGASAADASDRIVYNSATGALIYDSNGNAAGAATQFATLSAGLALSSADFIVV